MVQNNRIHFTKTLTCSDGEKYTDTSIDEIDAWIGLENQQQGREDADFRAANVVAPDPLLVPGATFETDVLVGLVSFGRDCARDNFPQVQLQCPLQVQSPVERAWAWVRDQRG